MSKKGIFSPTLLVVLVLVLGYSYYALVINEAKDFRFVKTIGQLQSEMIGLYQEAEHISFYIDQSAKQSIYYAIYRLGERGGFFGDGCGRTKEGYAIWLSKEKVRCYPFEFKRDFMAYFTEIFYDFFDLYSERRIPEDNYDLVFMDNSIIGTAKKTISLTKEIFAEGVGSAEDADNKVISCRKGECISELAKRYTILYKGLPYVWGGESPYSYGDSINDKLNNPDSIFKGVSITEYQPPGYMFSGNPTVAGFDCSGFSWWVLKHAGIVDKRLSATGYLELAKSSGTEICSLDSCDMTTIKKKAKPGDLIFIHPCPRGVCHMGIYTGNGRIAESIGTRGVVERNIPDIYLPGGKYPIASIYRLPYEKLTVPEELILEEEEIYDAPIDYSYAIYYLDPSFKVDVDYDFSDFEIIKEKVDSLILLCEKSDCFRSRIEAINKGELLIAEIERDNFIWRIRDSDNYVLFDVSTGEELFHKPLIIKFALWY